MKTKIKSSELKNKRLVIGQITLTSIKTYHMLKKDGIDISMFFDKDFRLISQKYDHTAIFPWSNFYGAYIILTIPSRYKELRNLLVEFCGYDDEHIIYLEDIEFICNESDIENDLDWEWIKNYTANPSDMYRSYKNSLLKDKYKQDVFAPLLAIDVNNKCTLNCKYCYTQMPYYQNSEKRNYDIDKIIANIDKLLDKVDYIPYLWILGGEPLLHPELDKLIDYLNSPKVVNKVVYAEILTNGTLLLSDRAVAALKRNPLYWRVSVSPYGEHSRKQYELFSQLSEAGIPYYSRYMVYWQKFGRVTEPQSFDEDEIRAKCEMCVCKNMHMSENYIYRCPVLAHFVALKKIPFDERNSFDCTGDYTKEMLREYFNGVCPGMAYCNGNHQLYISETEADEFAGDFVPVAEQAEGVISYKRYE